MEKRKSAPGRKPQRRAGALHAGISACILVMMSVLSALPAYAWDGTVTEAGEEDAAAQGSVLYPYVDAWDHVHTTVWDQTLLPRQYDLTKFYHDGMDADYTGDPRYLAIKGVDVSEFNGTIDWSQVAAAGYRFAIIRAGYSTFSTGSRHIDKNAVANIVAAQQAGIPVGVYFYSQAVSKEEAAAEAQVVLSVLQAAQAGTGIPIQLPVFYDPEYRCGKPARNDGLTKEQFTADTEAFCDVIQTAGYQAGVYANMIFESACLDMHIMQNYHVWFADYRPLPQSLYAFEYWQYSEQGTVPGIPGATDMNLWLIPVPAADAAAGTQEQ